MARTNVRLVMKTGRAHWLPVAGTPREVYEAIAKATRPVTASEDAPPVVLEGIGGDIVVFRSEDLSSADFDVVREDIAHAVPANGPPAAEGQDFVNQWRRHLDALAGWSKGAAPKVDVQTLRGIAADLDKTDTAADRIVATSIRIAIGDEKAAE